MRSNTVFVIKILGISTLLVQCRNGENTSLRGEKPNIILILADDLGYGDLGIYGQNKIETPNIDKLANSGILFTQFYSGAPVSAPARCILLTGMHSGHAQVRGNDEWAGRGDVWNYRAMIADSTLEGQKPLAEGTVTLAHLLKEAGYITGMTGKWGLGAPHTPGIPTRMGFDWFFGYNCQRMAHTYYPLFLYENERRYWLNNDTVAPNTKLAPGADPYKAESYAPFNLKDYAPEVMFRKMTDFIRNNRDNPFFLYWATTIPHAALQAPKRWIDYYVKKFGDEQPYLGEKGYFPHRYPRAAYAAMVSYLDEQVGMMVTQLKELGIYENTLIIFTSDNGPTYNGGTDSKWFNSGGPFRSDQGYGKGNLNEGGIRVPMIASWPARIKAGVVSDHVSVFYDILPTFCEIARADEPENADGISFLPELLGLRQKQHDYLYWEFPESGGQIALRIGDYKAISKNIHKGNIHFEIYDLKNDPGETENIASQHPELLESVTRIIGSQHQSSPNERWQFKILDEKN